MLSFLLENVEFIAMRNKMTAHQTEMWQSYLEVVKRGLLKHLRNVVLIDTAWFPKA